MSKKSQNHRISLTNDTKRKTKQIMRDSLRPRRFLFCSYSLFAMMLFFFFFFCFFFFFFVITGIEHGFSCINIRQVPWEVLKTEAEGRGFQRLPRDLANINALKNHVRSLLLHKN